MAILDESSCDSSSDIAQCQSYLNLQSDVKRRRTKKEQEYIKDVWSVEQVSFTFKSVSKPSPIIDKIIRNKKFDHDAALENLKIELENLRDVCEAKIQEFKKNLELKVNSIHLSIKNKQNNFNEIQKNKLVGCRKIALNDFHVENQILQNAGVEYLKNMEGKAAFYRLKSRKSIITEVVAKWDITIPFSMIRLEEQFKQLDCAISSIGNKYEKCINSYKTYIFRYVCRLRYKLKKLRKLEDMSETIDEIGSKIAEEIYNSEKLRIENFLAKLDNTNDLILKNIRYKVKGIFKIFNDFGSPWDIQLASFAKLQNAVMKQLGNRAEKGLQYHLNLQENIDAEIKNLREGNSIEILDKILVQVFAILDRKNKRFNSDYEEDCRIIKKCKNTLKTEVLSMKNKIDKFLEINMPTEYAESLESSYESDNDCSDIINVEDIIFQELELIERQTDSLDTWKSNFLINMSSYQSWLEKDTMSIVETWVNELLFEAARSLENNLKSVEKSRNNICKTVYDIRAKELLEHQNKLELHKKVGHFGQIVNMITGLIEESAKCADTFLNFTDIIDTYKSMSSQMLKEDGTKIKTSGQVTSLINMVCYKQVIIFLTKLKEEHKNSITLKITCTSERMMKKTSLMTNYNESFLSRILLFELGGNFTIEELNLAKKEISQLFKDIQKDKSENCIRIKKVTDGTNCEIQNIEKSVLDSLNITMGKLKVKEDIMNATKKCEYFVELKVKYLKELNDTTMNEVIDFIEKCQNKLSLNELIKTLNKLIQSLQNLPEDIRSSKDNLKNNTKNETQLKLSTNEKNCFTNSEQNYNSNNYAAVVKFIQDALSIIIDRGTVIEQSSFPDKNILCENCIHDSLQRIHVIYSTVCNYWIEETSSKLFHKFHFYV
ncbi:PREDICTED: uncharacterized protein LOC105359076 [Ceratosolen solmsi marchali]|uniref:Uncharacterized protein LOC105359076 n=1 Tax=Ceratosolen solmsi marchali TaxID=326594 RepID=A0AAJ6VII1_9HYME|nr:PREDICTED: uncharacterized protein LOC105359076 [Ceratosolen solmsi marchali]